MSRPQRVIGYARVSSEEQARLDLEQDAPNDLGAEAQMQAAMHRLLRSTASPTSVSNS